MRIYISGAITGTTDYEERFREAEKKLIKAGHKVINPVKVNGVMPDGATHEDYMTMSFAMMDICDAVYFMPGWQQSRGANQEYGYAIAKNMPRYFNCE
ncbi:MAG: DUF4406 domain-containing protein [Lachnospiraceae bacterium]|nr:DUF4406 domain-containing protein [Lachnospiraceae bacterium]